MRSCCRSTSTISTTPFAGTSRKCKPWPKIIERNRQIDEGVFAALENPREKTVPPQKETVPPFLGFAPLQNGLAALERTTADFDRTLARASENGGRPWRGRR